MPEQVFICYAREDEDFVLKLAGALKAQGVPVWIDQWDIPGSADWDMAIDEALSKSTHMLVVLSPASMKSGEVRSEWRAALQARKPLVPVLFQMCIIHRRLQLIQHIDFTSKSPTDADALGEIVSALGMEKPTRTRPIHLDLVRTAGPADPDDPFAYDVFISYSSADRGWVRGELLQRLEAAGLKVCIDRRDLEPGAPSVIEMERAVRTSRRTLLVLTPAYLESAWTEFEVLMLQVLDPANRNRRLIPLLREACDLPPRIGYLTYVDFAQPEDWDLAWVRLLTALDRPPLQEAPDVPTPAAWRLVHPYPMPPNFTGRVAEREMLDDWLAGGAHPLLVMRALGGLGKSALAWHWLLHDVDAGRWPGALWWDFYNAPSFEGFLREALEYLGQPGALQLTPRQQVVALLRLLQQPGVLLILDGFERVLRAYGRMDAAYLGDADPTAGTPEAARLTDCVSPIAEHFLRGVASLPGIRSKVLLTTRLRPHVLEGPGGELLAGCREEELTRMQPDDAVRFFRARGVRGGRAEIEEACALYGYHPLSLSLLAGLVMRDPRQPGDIAAAHRLDLMGDLRAQQHYVLETAYNNLDAGGQRLLSLMACFRGAVEYEALAALAQEAWTPLDDGLRELVGRGLLHHDRRAGKYDLNPIVRGYAYDRLADKAGVHGQLRDYFAAVPEPEAVQSVEDLAPVIELYHHTVRAGRYDEALWLFRDRLSDSLYIRFGAYQTDIELLRALFPDGEDQPPRLKDEADQTWTLSELANSYSLSGQPRPAAPLFEASNAVDEKRGDKGNLAVGLGNLAYMAQIYLGELAAAEQNLRRSIEVCREIGDKFQEAVGHLTLGGLLAYRGAFDEADQELAVALELFQEVSSTKDWIAKTWAHSALGNLYVGDYRMALGCAKKALNFSTKDAKENYPVERDFIVDHWLLGRAHQGLGEPLEAEPHLTEALSRCRRINLVELEPDILLAWARWYLTKGNRDEALRHAEEALNIADRCEYRLKQADIHNFLAAWHLAGGDPAQARRHAQIAKERAWCDGPPHSYQPALDEAARMLAEIDSPIP